VNRNTDSLENKIMKTSLIRMVLLTVSLSAFACSSAPSEPDLGSTNQALISLDASWDPEPEPTTDAGEPPPPPPPTTTCSNVTNDGVCRRYCCTESTGSKRCGVLPCPASTTTGTIIWGGGTLLAK
jgi:hypothetical protein